MANINKYGVLLDWAEHKKFMALLRSEVDKANRRLSRMNDFQKSIFADKGITKISRSGDIENKLKALSQARIVNESGISTAREYNKYVDRLATDLSLSKKEVNFMLNNFDSKERDFISKSPLKYGSNPQVDFLYEDVIELNDVIANNIHEMEQYIADTDSIANELYSIIYGL